MVVLTLNGVSTNDSRTLTNQDPNLVEAATLVQDGKVLLEMGKLDQAEAKLRKALDLDPQNNAAAYYLSLVHEARLNVATLNVATSRRGSDAQTMVHTNLIYTSKGRQATASKLNSIRLNSVQYDGVALSDVVRSLASQAKSLDSDMQGINFIVETNITSLPITIQPAMTDVPLAVVLDAIVKNADKPIKYSLEDFAVVFSLKTDADLQRLFIRSFKVDTNVFLANVRKRAGITSTNVEDEIKALRKLFFDAGVDLQPPKRIFYNDRASTLLIRASLKDLEIVEREIQVQMLNDFEPLINIKSEFVELPDALAQSLMKEFFVTNSVNNVTNGGFSVVLNVEQPKDFLKRCERSSGANVLAMPEVTTLSGRRAQVQMVDVMTIVTGINPRALVGPGITTTNGAEIYQLETMRFGPVMDLIPYLSEDGYTIQLTAIPSVTEFLGYDKLTNSVTVYVNGKKQSVQPPLPHIHTQKISSSVVVFDGDTLVLGGLVSEEVSKVKDKTPILGDLPLVGSAFRSESSTTTKKKVLVFITPTLVDPAGNRLHTDEDMPFTQNGVPVQTK
jgi:tetratricopeptide (TPR) repeat protein